MAGALQAHPVHHGHCTADKRDADRKDRRIRRLQKDYAAFCEYYFPHFLQLRDKVTGEVIRTIHNAPFHNTAAVKVKNTPEPEGSIQMAARPCQVHPFRHLHAALADVPAQAAHQLHGGRRKKRRQRHTPALGHPGRAEFNARIIADFGEQKSVGDWQEGEFTSQSGVKFLACGRGQSPRGLREREARPDYIVIDDLDDDELCRNEKRVKDLTDWVKEALFGALDVGRGRFIMVGNLISKTSVLANIAATKGVYVSEVKAVDRDGNPVWKEKWTKDEAQEYRDFVGYRAWEKR